MFIRERELILDNISKELHGLIKVYQYGRSIDQQVPPVIDNPPFAEQQIFPPAVAQQQEPCDLGVVQSNYL